MKIRKYEKEDEKKVKKLIESVLLSIYKKTKVNWENFEEYLIFFIAEEKGEIIGTAALKKVNKKIVKLKRMYVKVEQQNKGIGKMLLNKTISFSKDNSFKKIILTTYPEMKNAIEFYKKSGFKIVQNPSTYFFTNPKLIEYNKKQIAMEKILQ